MTGATKRSALLTLEASHGRVRVATRRPSDGGTPPLPPCPADAAAERDPQTGRFLPSNRAARRRVIKRLAHGITTLNPTACAPWLAPSVKEGIAYAMQLAERFPDPALARLVGAAADAHAVYRGLLVQGSAGDAAALTEARAWLREMRATLRELAVLGAAMGKSGTDTEAPWLERGDDS